jgi:hypothetical protein
MGRQNALTGRIGSAGCIKPNKQGAVAVAAWFRLLYVAIAAAASLNLLVVLKLVDGTGYSMALEKGSVMLR